VCQSRVCYSRVLLCDSDQGALSDNLQLVLIHCPFRGPVEADAQSVRVAVLLDELQAPDDGIRRHREGHIICEV